ncbi:hypothetical protein DL770_010415 [Monosporascus sp. CRB-9-2]|nr:hypothetical protein DL770_010415 [Monosporascus sp. CRB-9-2]
MEVTSSSASSSSASAQPTIDKSLQNAIREFQSILTDEQRRQLYETRAVPEADSILRFTAELDSRDKNRRGPSIASRLYLVLLSVRDFCSIFDTFVSSHPEIAALVWGSVKLSMQVIVNYASYFEVISGLFMKLGNLCPLFAEYQILYSSSERLQRALVDFHASIVRCWHNQIIRAVWKSSEQEFKSDMDSIQGYSDDVKDAIALAKAQADAQDQQLQALERKEASESRRKLSTFFSRHDSQVDQIRKWQIQKNERQIPKSSEAVQQYHKLDFPDARIRSMDQWKWFPFALVLRQDELDEVVELLQGITPVRKPSYLIIDGLDECDKPERNKLLKALSTLAFPALNTKLFLSSRSSLSEEIQNTFPSFERLTMSESLVHDDIKTYVNGVIEQKLENKDLRVGDASLIEDIKQALIQGADGMSTKSAHSIATRISAKLSKIFQRA